MLVVHRMISTVEIVRISWEQTLAVLERRFGTTFQTRILNLHQPLRTNAILKINQMQYGWISSGDQDFYMLS